MLAEILNNEKDQQETIDFVIKKYEAYLKDMKATERDTSKHQKNFFDSNEGKLLIKGIIDDVNNGVALIDVKNMSSGIAQKPLLLTPTIDQTKGGLVVPLLPPDQLTDKMTSTATVSMVPSASRQVLIYNGSPSTTITHTVSNTDTEFVIPFHELSNAAGVAIVTPVKVKAAYESVESPSIPDIRL